MWIQSSADDVYVDYDHTSTSQLQDLFSWQGSCLIMGSCQVVVVVVCVGGGGVLNPCGPRLAREEDNLSFPKQNHGFSAPRDLDCRYLYFSLIF